MRCPRGSPRLTSMPLRTTKGLRIRTLESAAGTSTCQPVRSLPLKRLCAWRCDAQRDVELNAVATQSTRIRNGLIRSSVHLEVVGRDDSSAKARSHLAQQLLLGHTEEQLMIQ